MYSEVKEVHIWTKQDLYSPAFKGRGVTRNYDSCLKYSFNTEYKCTPKKKII